MLATRHLITTLALTGTLLSARAATPPATATDQAEELAKKLNNPVADLISVPFQNNFLFNVGPGNGFRELTNIQPVIPFELNEHWNLISRTVLPVIYQEGMFPGSGHQFGLGDTVQSLFFSPKSPDPFIWGLGPAMLLPTATDDLLGNEQWGAGPTGVILKQSGPWTVGMLANQLWSVGGNDGRETVNATYMQPFVAYTTHTHTTFTLNSESTYDWTGRQWTMPFNAGVSQILKLGDQPVSIGLMGTWYAEAPASAPDWGIRLIFTFLFPKS
jgi:hypothetical protein